MQDSRNTPNNNVLPTVDSSTVNTQKKNNGIMYIINSGINIVSSLGKYFAIIIAILVTVFCLVFLFSGLSMLYYNFKYSSSVDGIATQDATPNQTSSPSTYQTEVQYTIDGSIYNGILYYPANTDKNILHKSGDKVHIRYNPKNPKQIYPGDLLSMRSATFMIFFSITFISLIWFWVYITRKNKIASTLSGISAIEHII